MRYIDADKFIAELEQEKTVALEFEDGVAVYEIEHTMNLIGMQPTADVLPKSEVDDLKRYIILNEDIAIKCKQENGEQNEEYWKGKISAFRQILAYIEAELKKIYTEEKE